MFLAGSRIDHGLIWIPELISTAGAGIGGVAYPNRLSLHHAIARGYAGMALLNLTAAARVVGCNRSTIARALKSGRLSASINDRGERCIDTSELMRVFGTLQGDAQAHGQADAYPVPKLALGQQRSDAQAGSALVNLLQQQLQEARERELRLIEEKARLLTLLEQEQTSRVNLETRLLTFQGKKKDKKRD